MKNYYYYGLSLSIFVMAVVAFTACEDDDNPKVVSYLNCPDDHHPHLIDLGLPSGTLWACCNVGASIPEGYGGYYAWGETEEKSEYSKDNYVFFEQGLQAFRDLGHNILGTEHDVAHVRWGGQWQMPSREQFLELDHNCSSEWTNVNGVNGRKFLGKNSGSIFLPAAWCRWVENTSDYTGLLGFYWLGRNQSQNDFQAEFIRIDMNGLYIINGSPCYGYPIRPIVKR